MSPGVAARRAGSAAEREEGMQLASVPDIREAVGVPPLPRLQAVEVGRPGEAHRGGIAGRAGV